MTHALPLLLALSFASGPAAPPAAEAVEARVHAFERLTAASAAWLEGKRILAGRAAHR